MRSAKLGRGMLAAGLLCGAAALNACNNPASGQAPPPPLAALPPTTAASPPLTPAPAADQLPPAPAPPLRQVAWPGDAYAFADRAYAMDVAFADSPPDYDFYDDSASPWVWVADDGSECIAELTPIGWRYYYFDPGADEPFFIEDPEYAYGFEGGALVVIYDHFGREYPADAMGGQDEIAGQFLTRAAALRQAAARDPHQAVSAADWSAHRGVIAGPRQAWAEAAASNPTWSAYRTQHAAQDQAHWNGERLRREAWAARVDASLGDPRRAAAEWQTAAAQAARGGSASSWRSAAWTGWRGAPPPVAQMAAATQRAPQRALAGASPPPLTSGRAYAGRGAVGAIPASAAQARFGSQPSGQSATSPRVAGSFAAAGGAAPRMAERAPASRFERAPSAQSYGAAAAARAPERTPERTIERPPSATRAPSAAPRVFERAPAAATRAYAAPRMQQAPPAMRAPAPAPRAFSAPRAAPPAQRAAPAPHAARAAHAPPPAPRAANSGGRRRQQ